MEPTVKGMANPVHMIGFLKKGLQREVCSPSAIMARGSWTRGKVRRSCWIHWRRRMTIVQIMAK